MRRVLAIGLSVLALGVGGARADAANRGGGLGGGLLEFLATGGRTGSPAPAPALAPGVQTASLTPDAAEPQREIPPQFHRQEVAYDGPQAPGVVIVDTPDRYLYLVEPGGRALRYGIGVGRPGFEWAGVKTVTRKAEWPGWTPPSQMLLRRPDLPRHMVGGLGNPLGARALYLGSSLYRIHGTNEPWTIGQNVSSGCIRMMNDDVMDLFNRVEVGTKVVVM